RADRDGDGKYDDALGPAAMDAWWPKLVAAMFGPAGTPFETLGVGIDSTPSTHQGSAFDSGAYSAVLAEAHAALGAPGAAGSAVHACGNGSREACRTAL